MEEIVLVWLGMEVRDIPPRVYACKLCVCVCEGVYVSLYGCGPLGWRRVQSTTQIICL